MALLLRAKCLTAQSLKMPVICNWKTETSDFHTLSVRHFAATGLSRYYCYLRAMSLRFQVLSLNFQLSSSNDLHQRLATAERSGAVDSPLDVIVMFFYPHRDNDNLLLALLFDRVSGNSMNTSRSLSTASSSTISP